MDLPETVWHHNAFFKSIEIDRQSDFTAARVQHVGHAHRIAMIQELLKAKCPVFRLSDLLLQLGHHLKQLLYLRIIGTVVILLAHDIRCAKRTFAEDHLGCSRRRLVLEQGLVHCLAMIVHISTLLGREWGLLLVDGACSDRVLGVQSGSVCGVSH